MADYQYFIQKTRVPVCVCVCVCVCLSITDVGGFMVQGATAMWLPDTM